MFVQFKSTRIRNIWWISSIISILVLLVLGTMVTYPSLGYAQSQNQPKGIIINPSDELSIEVWVDKSTYRIGEYIKIHFSTNQKGYVYIWDIDTAGVVRQIFPNRYSQDNYLPAGKHTLPDKGYSFLVAPPPGTEYLQAILSKRKLDLTPQEFKQEFPVLSQKPEEFSQQMKGKIQAIVPTRDWATAWTSFEVTFGVSPAQRPTAQFNYSPSRPEVGSVVTFDASGSSDPDGWIKSYRWDFDSDGKVDSYGQRVTHRFYSPGYQQIRLTVIDNRNLSDSVTKAIRVVSKPANRQPIAQFNYTPKEPLVGTIVDFDASGSYDPDGYLTDYEWDFNQDGRADASGRQVSYYFHRTGSHPVTLKVRDNQGATDSITKEVVIRSQINRSPVASFTYSPDSPQVGNPVRFNASPSYDPDGWLTEYRWDFNQDGRTDAYGSTASYTFNNPGNFRVTLTVVDNQGSSSSASQWIQVSGPKPPPFPQIGAGFWIQSVGRNQLRIVVNGKNWWFNDHNYKIKLETDGRFTDVDRGYPGPAPMRVIPVTGRSQLELSGSIRNGWTEYLITVSNTTKIKFNLQLDIDGDGALEQRTDFIYLGENLKHPPSNPFVVKFPSGNLTSWISAQICLSLIDQPGFNFMVCFNWNEF